MKSKDIQFPAAVGLFVEDSNGRLFNVVAFEGYGTRHDNEIICPACVEGYSGDDWIDKAACTQARAITREEWVQLGDTPCSACGEPASEWNVLIETAEDWDRYFKRNPGTKYSGGNVYEALEKFGKFWPFD